MNWNLPLESAAPLFGIITIGLSALVGALAYLYKLGAHERRVTNKVLYLLLEIRFAVVSAQFLPHALLKIEEELEVSIKKEFGAEAEVSSTENAKNWNKKIAEEVSEVIGTIIDAGLVRDYESALVALSESKPFIASKLKNKTKLESVIKLILKQHSEFDSQWVKDYPESSKKIKVIEYVEYERKLLIEGILKGLDRDILRLARGSSKVLWVRTFVHLLKHSYPKSKNSANDAMNKRRLKFEKEIKAMSENGEAGELTS